VDWDISAPLTLAAALAVPGVVTIVPSGRDRP
jgi:hypothetical protein